jgi:hypothetical protein
MNWETRIDIHQYIKLGKDLNDDDLVPANIREGLIKEIEKLPFHLRNHFAWILDDLRLPLIVAEFNDLLGRIYEVADSHKVWLGMPSFV